MSRSRPTACFWPSRPSRSAAPVSTGSTSASTACARMSSRRSRGGRGSTACSPASPPRSWPAFERSASTPSRSAGSRRTRSCPWPRSAAARGSSCDSSSSCRSTPRRAGREGRYSPGPRCGRSSNARSARSCRPRGSIRGSLRSITGGPTAAAAWASSIRCQTPFVASATGCASRPTGSFATASSRRPNGTCGRCSAALRRRATRRSTRESRSFSRSA